MRAFLAACLAIVILAVAGYFFTDALQELSAGAFTTESVRIDPGWTVRAGV